MGSYQEFKLMKVNVLATNSNSNIVNDEINLKSTINATTEI